jgi:hypothetical protein
MLGFTVSRGAPGGPAKGEYLADKQQFETRFNLSWPDIKRQIQRGDLQGAQNVMDAIRVPAWMQRSLQRSAVDPAASLNGRTVREFMRDATPEQRARFERARGQ